jgi:hypothetical protein
MKPILALTLVFLGTATALAVEPKSSDRVDPLMDCSTPVLDADSPEKVKLLRVQYGGDALTRELRETYAPRLAGIFWNQQEGAESRLVLRLTGDETVETRRLTICGEPLTVAFISGQLHTAEQLKKLHADNLEWFRGAFPGLQGTYADERTGEIVLEIYAPAAEGADIEAIRREVQAQLAVSLRVETTTEKVGPAILNLTPAVD